MSRPAHVGLGPLVLAACAFGACAAPTDPFASEQLELDCRGAPCPWTVVAGTPRLGATWEAGDVGVDLSGTGPCEVEQQVVMLQQTSRTLDLRAGVVRDSGAELRFELQWFAPGPGFGSTFWDRQPIDRGTTTFEVWESGSAAVRRTVVVPSEATAFVFRIVKGSSGQATAMVGDLTLGHPAGSSS